MFNEARSDDRSKLDVSQPRHYESRKETWQKAILLAAQR